MALQIRRPATAFALSTDKRKRPRVHVPNHLDWIRELPGLTDGVVGSTEAAHIRMGSLSHGKRPAGLAEKPSDQAALQIMAAARGGAFPFNSRTR